MDLLLQYDADINLVTKLVCKTDSLSVLCVVLVLCKVIPKISNSMYSMSTCYALIKKKTLILYIHMYTHDIIIQMVNHQILKS